VRWTEDKRRASPSVRLSLGRAAAAAKLAIPSVAPRMIDSNKIGARRTLTGSMSLGEC
jgi:hypothetical protein